ncbi:Protein kinase domain [Dillenia turbinata]|uniref:Protein kinase domain n=1 Tax=Dillenia turbinata TaxID=194707 RepID=A0AAN8ZCE3_9MAGN
MEAHINGLYLTTWIFSTLVSAAATEHNLLSCQTSSPDAFGYRCSPNESQNQCKTFALLRTNSYYSSLFNLSNFLGINRYELADANGFSTDTEFLPLDQPLLIPVECKCNGWFFEANLTKTTIHGESFHGIAESLEGLTTCRAIWEKNPSISPWNLTDKLQLLLPLRCACPSSSELVQDTKILLSYPVSEGDTITKLAFEFNTTSEAIISTNNRSSVTFRGKSLIPDSSVLIPLKDKPVLGSLAKPHEPDLNFPATSIPVIIHRKKGLKMWKLPLIIALSSVAFGAILAVAAIFLAVQWKRKKCNVGDLELQQLSLSVRTTSDKKVSFEGSQDPLEGQIIDSTPRKMIIETYSIDELRKATEDFNSSNLIEGSVFHGRLNGKNIAIKRTQAETILKIDFALFQDARHHHPNIIRLIGTCLTGGSASDSYLVFEYAKNGSLKDWLHGGLALKSQFIASCYCFLTWNQRLRICLDVAMALQYMHHIMNHCYVHRNIKSGNIFLDEEFNAKIGNFGMAKCTEGSGDSSQPYSANPSSWSKGYLAPEYIGQGTVSPSMDIFAYGVVLLEILSAKTPITRSEEKEGNVWLCEKIKSILQSEDAEDLRQWMDTTLGEDYSFDAAVALANLARACVEEDPCLRPTAGEIVEKLGRLVEELPEGDQFSFCESSSKPLVKAICE